jgi:predicted RNase H-like nuclease (RuvC/YqgF family)
MSPFKKMKNTIEKALPPLPTGRDESSRTRSTAQVGPVFGTTQSLSDNHVQSLKERIKHLKQQVSQLQSENEEKDRFIKGLEGESRARRQELDDQQRLIVEIANAISDALGRYQRPQKQAADKGRPARHSITTVNQISYEDLISAWSDESS